MQAAGNAYPGDLTPFVTATCFVAAMGGLGFGYDIGISGGVTSMPMFLKKFFPSVYKIQEKVDTTLTNQYCKFDDQSLMMFTSSLYLAALVSSLMASTVSRRFGHKASMLLGGILFFAGSITNVAAQNIAMLIIGRILIGFGVGFTNQSVPLYLSEMAPFKYRGALNISFQLSITIGILVANVLNYFFASINNWGWRLSLGGAVVPSTIIIVGSLILPDSPNSLIERGFHEEATNRLRNIRGIHDITMELSYLAAVNHASKNGENHWRNLLRRKHYPHLTMAIAIPFFQQLTGINSVMFYAPALFKTIGFSDNASLISAIIPGVLNVGATVLAVYGVDRWGRRFLFLEGGIQMFICQVIVALCIGLKFGMSGTTEDIPKWFAIIVVFVICIFVVAYAWSWGPLGWLVPSEIFPLEIRSAAQSISVSVNMLFTFVVAHTFLTMLCHLKFTIFLFFACFLLFMSVFIYFLLPETKGIPIEEMNIVWKNHAFWGRFFPDDELP